MYLSGERMERKGICTFRSLNSAKCKCEFTNFAHEVTLRNNFTYLSRVLICVSFYHDDDRSRYLDTLIFILKTTLTYAFLTVHHVNGIH